MLLAHHFLVPDHPQSDLLVQSCLLILQVKPDEALSAFGRCGVGRGIQSELVFEVQELELQVSHLNAVDREGVVPRKEMLFAQSLIELFVRK